MNDYPKMLYASDGPGTKVVKTQEEQDAAGPGWGLVPSDAHRAPQAVTTPPLQPGQEAFIEAVAQRTAELVMGELGKAAPTTVPEPSPTRKSKAAMQEES